VQIEAAGKTWIVEEQELERGFGSGWDRLSGVTFQNADREPDRLFVRWVLTPERLTPRLAQELFELAAVRLWQDPRDARPYQLHLETQTAPPARGGALLEAIRFESEDGEAEAPWTLGKPLGWASDAELMDLLDRALESAPRVAPPIPGA
jgi:hypothetical protein